MLHDDGVRKSPRLFDVAEDDVRKGASETGVDMTVTLGLYAKASTVGCLGGC